MTEDFEAILAEAGTTLEEVGREAQAAMAGLDLESAMEVAITAAEGMAAPELEPAIRPMWEALRRGPLCDAPHYQEVIIGLANLYLTGLHGYLSGRGPVDLAQLRGALDDAFSLVEDTLEHRLGASRFHTHLSLAPMEVAP